MKTLIFIYKILHGVIKNNIIYIEQTRMYIQIVQGKESSQS